MQRTVDRIDVHKHAQTQIVVNLMLEKRESEQAKKDSADSVIHANGQSLAIYVPIDVDNISICLDDSIVNLANRHNKKKITWNRNNQYK